VPETDLNNWPPAEERIAAILREHETQVLEFKRQWYAMDTKPSKGEFVRDIIALGNSADSRRAAYLVVGVEDKKQGGAIVGLDYPIDREQAMQVLTSYATPLPEIRFVEHTNNEGKLIAVVGVFATPHQPYYATRTIEGTLKANSFYVRRGSIVGETSAPEILHMMSSRSRRISRSRQSDSPYRSASSKGRVDWPIR